MSTKYKNLFSRWHRFDEQGKKHIKRFELNETPNPLKETGYTEWVRGTGPLSEQHYNNVKVALQKACLGKPKSIEHRQKMRLAKLGVPKSEEHKRNMSISQRRRIYGTEKTG